MDFLTFDVDPISFENVTPIPDIYFQIAQTQHEPIGLFEHWVRNDFCVEAIDLFNSFPKNWYKPEILKTFNIETVKFILTRLDSSRIHLTKWRIITRYTSSPSKILELLSFLETAKDASHLQFTAREFNKYASKKLAAYKCDNLTQKVSSCMIHDVLVSKSFEPKVFTDLVKTLSNEIVPGRTYRYFSRRADSISMHYANCEPVTWKLLFRASEHEFRAEAFHKACADKGQTVTIVKTDTERIAAFSSESFSTHNKVLSCDKGFILIFLRNDGSKWKKRMSSVITCQESLGPCFGTFSSPELFISGNDDISEVDAISGVDDTSHARQVKGRGIFNGNDPFTVQEYEVYSIEV